MVSGEKLCKNKSKLSTTKKKKCEKNGNIVWKKSKLWEEKFELWEKDKIGGGKSQNCEKKVKIVRINVKKVIIS